MEVPSPLDSNHPKQRECQMDKPSAHHSRHFFQIICLIHKPGNVIFYQDCNTALWSVLENYIADAGYRTIFMPGNQGVQVFNGNNVKVNLSGDAVLRGWRDPQGLWRVPMDDGEDITLSQQQLEESVNNVFDLPSCLLYTSPSPRDGLLSRMPSSA